MAKPNIFNCKVKFSFYFKSTKLFSNLQVCLFNLICAIRSQGQNQTEYVAELSEVILRAHFSKYSLQLRDANFKKFYSEALRLIKDVESAPRSVSLFEVYDHRLMVIDHPRSTSRSEFVKIQDFLEMLVWSEMPLTQINNLLSELDEMIFAVKAASDPINELSKRLDFFLNVSSQILKDYETRRKFYQRFPLRPIPKQVLRAPAVPIGCKYADTSQTLPKDPVDETPPESG